MTSGVIWSLRLWTWNKRRLMNLSTSSETFREKSEVVHFISYKMRIINTFAVFKRSYEWPSQMSIKQSSIQNRRKRTFTIPLYTCNKLFEDTQSGSIAPTVHRLPEQFIKTKDFDLRWSILLNKMQIASLIHNYRFIGGLFKLMLRFIK